MMKKRRQLPPRLSLSAGFTWMGRVIWSGQKTEQQRAEYVCVWRLHLSIQRFVSAAARDTYVCLKEGGQDSPNKSESSHRRREINAGLLIQALGLCRVSGWEEFCG
ncbi:hypothetical protein ATANTOWER_008825 [Ataeniobius toweri]|uniref:Uncharacterized protein n=1 Tax=Ataeniobius toweri TaxID=208326 RepID=A0ABU7BNK7_9TELE|nr:hypothetical protein [Ataeniobius toweri]